MSRSTSPIQRRARSAAVTVVLAAVFAAACGGASRSDEEETGGGGPVGGNSDTGGTGEGATPNDGGVTASGAGGDGSEGANGGISGSDEAGGAAPEGGVGGVLSGGASSGGSAGGSSSGGTSGGGGGVGGAPGGGSPSGGAPGGDGPTGGVVLTGGAEAGGVPPGPSCPDSPPTDREPCGDDQACFYDDCPGAGLTRAGCLDSVWHVRTTPCCPDAVPAIGDACPGDDYFCVYGGDCPGGELSKVHCEGGEWRESGLSPRPCCPTEPPGSDAVSCGPDVMEQRGAGYLQYSCGWQDCGSYGAASGNCNSSGLMTSTWTGGCERFFCGNGNTDPNYYCEAGQVCLDFGLVEYVVGGGHVFRCADNPCAPGVVELDCARDFICPTAEVVFASGARASAGTGSAGIYVSCLL